MNGNGTFSRTELISSPRVGVQDFCLPASVNFVSLRESFISDAPFVSKSNAAFWRRILDSKNFNSILAASYHSVVSCIAENGTFNIEQLYRLDDSPTIDVMASNFSQMFYQFTVKERDMLSPKLSELCTYMLINSLGASIPKHNRVYGSIKFREILLDFYSELFTGIRLSNSHLNREWLFNSAIDMPILLYESPNTVQEIKHNPSKGSDVTTYKMVNSPLVTRYIGLKPTQVCSYGVNLSLSHLPERPLTTLNETAGFHTKKARNKVVYHEAVKSFLTNMKKTQNKIMVDFESTKKSTKDDIRKFKESTSLSLKWLSSQEKEMRIKSRAEIQIKTNNTASAVN